MAFLVVAAFLLTNKVYSPQYVLWLLPFVILARPRWRDWLVFTAGELIYFVAIWWHLGGLLAPGDSSADRIYWLAVIIRLLTQSWVVVLVVRDILLPSTTPYAPTGPTTPAAVSSTERPMPNGGPAPGVRPTPPCPAHDPPHPRPPPTDLSETERAMARSVSDKSGREGSSSRRGWPAAG